MKKDTNFPPYSGDGWPMSKWLEPYFLTEAGQVQAFGGQQSLGMRGYGLHGTEHLRPNGGRVDLNLTIQGDPHHGIMLWYNISGGGWWEAKYSRGDATKWRQWVELPQDHASVALFIPFETAWKAVKEFIERDGALPESIEWIADKDLPSYAFRPDLAN